MNKIYLQIYDKNSKKRFIKYFSSSYSKNKFKYKLQFSKDLFIIEDSEDIIFT